MPKITLDIDGRSYQAEAGELLLPLARRQGIFIPSLCFLEHLENRGACRLCLVKIQGRKGLAAACSTRVEEGMRIVSSDPELEELRRITLECILAEHHYDCAVCRRDGECELQDLAFRYGIGSDDPKRIVPSIWRDVPMPLDKSSPVLVYDAGRCIKCGRCISACDEVQGKSVISFIHRGFGSFVSPEMGMWKNSSCDGCGECVQSCPTGALSEKPRGGDFRSFDIDRKQSTTCGYCGVGCQIDLWIKDETIVRVRGRREEPNRGRLCVKGRFGYDFVHSSDRLRYPLLRKSGEFHPVSWEEALSYTVRRLQEIREKGGPSAVGALSSAKCTNEENYLFQKFFRTVYKTNNIDHCARLCHAPTVAGLARAFGSGAMTNSIEELAGSDCILVTGSNVTETHPVSATYIKEAVRRGAKLIVIDPRRIDLVSHADLWLRQKPGSDVAWINGMLNIIFSRGLADQNFIDTRTEGVEELRSLVAGYTPDRVEQISGIPAQQLEAAARIYAEAPASSIVYAMGITQHVSGTDNVLSLANLALACGQIGRPSTGVNPLRGQNNVQGACDLGALPNVFNGYQKVDDPELRRKFEKAWSCPDLSGLPGQSVGEMLDSAVRGELRGMYIMGENPMLSDPNLSHVKKALESLDFLVVQDIFLSETARMADIVLPAACFAEKDGTFTNSGRSVLRLRKAVDPPGEAKADWEILLDIFEHAGLPQKVSSPQAIFDEMAALSPSYRGISYRRLEQEKLHWPCPDPEHPGTRYLYRDRFSRGLGRFYPVDWIPPAELSDPDYPFLLSTGRMLYHYHTATMTRRSGALNSFAPDAYAEIQPDDLRRLGGRDGSLLRVESRRGSIEIPARSSGRVAPGEIFIPFHFFEAPANALTNDVRDPLSNIPELKVSACRIEVIT